MLTALSPAFLTSAVYTDAVASIITGKISDGLLTYDFDTKPPSPMPSTDWITKNIWYGRGVPATRLTAREFDITVNTVNCAADPAIDVQRFYWSKNVKPGVALSNSTHYSNPEVDKLPEAAATQANRFGRFLQFQRLVMADLPSLPLCSMNFATLIASSVKDASLGGTGMYSDQVRPRCWSAIC